MVFGKKILLSEKERRSLITVYAGLKQISSEYAALKEAPLFETTASPVYKSARGAADLTKKILESGSYTQKQMNRLRQEIGDVKSKSEAAEIEIAEKTKELKEDMKTALTKLAKTTEKWKKKVSA